MVHPARAFGCAFAIVLVAAAAVAAESHRHGHAAGAGTRRLRPAAIGVRTIQATDQNRPDILNTKPGEPTARYDRTLTIEIWYPAKLAAGQKPAASTARSRAIPAVTVTLHGQAARDAASGRDRRRRSRW